MACCSRTTGVAGRQITFGGSRPVTMDVPDLFDGKKLYPLLITLHSLGDTGAASRNRLGFRTAHNYRDGILILSPEGTVDPTGKQFWNATDACCNYYGSTVDDIGYVLGLVEEVIAAGWPVDLTRIGVAGYSNGAFLAHMIARCSNKADGARRITWGLALNGMGPLAGDSHGCAPVQPVHWLQCNGTLDVTVAYGGDATGTDVTGDAPIGPYPSALASAAAWAALNGVTGSLGATTGYYDFCQGISGGPGGAAESTVQIYAGAPANGSVTVVTMVGEDHVTAMQTGPDPALSWTLFALDHFYSHPRTP